MGVFCTLFDSNYLDKGLVMFESLSDVAEDFKLYILAMDDKCYAVLKEINDDRLIAVSLRDFENDEMKKAKATRSRAEYCWTCSSCLIEFVIKNYEESMCTYIDADLYFYSNPDVLLDEMENYEVQIVEHRFENTISGRASIASSGRFCVQFNTFKNSTHSMNLLSWWKEQCLKKCGIIDKKSKSAGDQGYLNDWDKYPFVQILKNEGGGLAPWNIGQYKLEKKNNSVINIVNRRSNKKFELVFYHFHNIDYLDDNLVDIYVYRNNWKVDDSLVESIYIPYLKKLAEKKKYLKNTFDVYPMIKSHPGLNKTKIKIRLYTPLSLYLGFRRKLINLRQGHKDRITIM